MEALLAYCRLADFLEDPFTARLRVLRPSLGLAVSHRMSALRAAIGEAVLRQIRRVDAETAWRTRWCHFDLRLILVCRFLESNLDLPRIAD